jgi:DNA-directed RNA polymerase subunit RPC12/RpoP
MVDRTDQPAIIAEKPSPFCVVRKSDPIEVQREQTAAWTRNVIRFQAFWDAGVGLEPDQPAWLRYWCGKCGERHNHDVNGHGPIATCPTCGNHIDLRPEGKFGGMDRSADKA